MNTLQLMLHNIMLTSALLSWAVAQFIKGVLILIREHRFNWHRFLGSGGMPSSHAATVTALCISSGFQYGADSGIFAIATILAIVVIYDARGVRREAGRHGHMLNEVQEFLASLSSPEKWLSEEHPEVEFDELVGHTPLEVAVGLSIGLIISLLMNTVFL